MKTVFLKRVAIVVIAILTMSLSASAQKKGDMDAGVNLLFGTTSGYSNAGLGAKFRYNIIDQVRLAGEFDYFLKSNYISLWDFSVYGHYLFPVAENLVVYPEVGLGFVGWSYSWPTGWLDSYSHPTDFALSIGGGVDYKLTSNLTLNGQLRFKTISGGWFNMLVGIAYKF